MILIVMENGMASFVRVPAIPVDLPLYCSYFMTLYKHEWSINEVMPEWHVLSTFNLLLSAMLSRL